MLRSHIHLQLLMTKIFLVLPFRIDLIDYRNYGLRDQSLFRFSVMLQGRLHVGRDAFESQVVVQNALVLNC